MKGNKTGCRSLAKGKSESKNNDLEITILVFVLDTGGCVKKKGKKQTRGNRPDYIVQNP